MYMVRGNQSLMSSRVCSERFPKSICLVSFLFLRPRNLWTEAPRAHLRRVDSRHTVAHARALSREAKYVSKRACIDSKQSLASSPVHSFAYVLLLLAGAAGWRAGGCGGRRGGGLTLTHSLARSLARCNRSLTHSRVPRLAPAVRPRRRTRPAPAPRLKRRVT